MAYHDHHDACEDEQLCAALELDPEFQSHHLPGFITGGNCSQLIIARGDAANALLGNISARDQYLARMRDFQARQTAYRAQQRRREARWN